MILTDIKNDNYIIERVDKIKIIFVDDTTVVLPCVSRLNIDLDKIESETISLVSHTYSKILHEYSNRGVKIKRFVLYVNAVDNSDFTSHDVKTVYDCDARIRTFGFDYDTTLGTSEMSVTLEGFFNG